MSQAVIKKWGNSPSVRIPAAIMKAVSLSIDDAVDIMVENGRIVIEPVHSKEYTLDALLSGVTDENIHEEISFGKPVGKEAL
ncbi:MULTISPECIES: AbrB/MazE/SpoVT family DNA-binding domain-containing protein [Xenorhabdus]|uniref:AbrB/MazE/SpoVT family DNA-binding domain-containing protein n=1 Tax=Xenorhabdus TaxID=626 RepID=UPI0006478902|nr:MULTISPECIES: AbrB/MazE/SpoVT family DNA-binding domain-containing protein [Xenorhabdus]MBC8944734.1 PbsX family transcriptional regulator [Xenorhabdus indica]